MRLDEIRQVYTDYAGRYEKEFTGERNYTAYKRLPRLVIRELKARKARILDLGCGTGLSSLLFFDEEYEVTGIDITRAMIRLASKLPFARLICQDLEKPLKVKDDYFDAVVMIGVMEHIDDPSALLSEVRKKLRRDGLFALTLPCKNSYFSEYGLRNYYKKDIEPLMRETGFKVVRAEKSFGYEDEAASIYYWNYLLRKTR
ncbi:MAG TPA: methyltransferase domain-containing protein [Blastocatellia bacterium]|jgi:SAM-dependent methyltransferase|nr:methyltransferase domain-containing protein [Blastocatellia bacterium]